MTEISREFSPWIPHNGHWGFISSQHQRLCAARQICFSRIVKIAFAQIINVYGARFVPNSGNSDKPKKVMGAESFYLSIVCHHGKRIDGLASMKTPEIDLKNVQINRHCTFHTQSPPPDRNAIPLNISFASLSHTDSSFAMIFRIAAMKQKLRRIKSKREPARIS